MRRLLCAGIAAAALLAATAQAEAAKLVLHAPDRVRAGRTWDLRVTGRTDHATRLYAYYALKACAHDRADEAKRVEHPLFDGARVGPGAFDRTRPGIHSGKVGSHHVCAYLKSGERAAKVLKVVEPPPTGRLRIAVANGQGLTGWSVDVVPAGLPARAVTPDAQGVAATVYDEAEYPLSVRVTVHPPSGRAFDGWGHTAECGGAGMSATCTWTARNTGGATPYGAPCCELQTVAFRPQPTRVRDATLR